jgi:heme exporter protein B
MPVRSVRRPRAVPPPSPDAVAGSLAGMAVEVARKDLRVEWRSGEALWLAVPFGAAALLLVPLAVGTDTPLLRRLGPGMYWVVVLLFGTLVTLRHSATDGPAQRDLLALLGVDPAARFLGHAAASGLFLVAFQGLLVPVTMVLYDPALPAAAWGWFAVLVPLVAAGLAALGALAAALAASLATRATLAPLLMVPLALPLLLGATQALEGAGAGRSPLPWLVLVATVDVVVVMAGLLSAPTLELEEMPG